MIARAALGAALLAGGPKLLAAQERLEWMAHGTVVARHASPAPGGGSDTEGYLTQPMLSLRAPLPGALSFLGTLNFESLTLDRGELTPGAWGEGYVDRRHPHTTVHELILSRQLAIGRARVGVAAGKGFVPFGTDDPMSRPMLSYPVNHHFAQILERAVMIVQFGVGPVLLEAALFNGDEPERPGQWPLLRHDGRWRFGDSWSARAQWRPGSAWEVQASLASVRSPEHRGGAGGNHDKQSLSVRWHRVDRGAERYFLVEYARTSELEGFFVFPSVLAEGRLSRGRLGVAYRFERTERPEEARLLDPYRAQRPHLENAILGVSRWTLHTARVDANWEHASGFRAKPFVEVTLGRVAKVGGGFADPVGTYGTHRVRHLAAGVVLSWRDAGHRMGRYGLASAPHHH